MFLSMEVAGQTPPQPMMTHEDGHTDCADDGGGTSPPLGLCLPIDGYVWYLVIGGALYGMYMSRKFREV